MQQQQPLTRRVSGPSRKATPSLICLMEASQPDLASPTYSCPSMFTLHDIITKHLLLPHNPSWNHCRITASTLHLPCVLPCVLHLCLVTLASYVLLRSPAFPCVTLCLHLVSSAVSSSLERSVGSPDWNKSIPLPVSIFPHVPIIRSLFHDLIDPSILPPVPRVQFRGDFILGLSKSSSPFLPPFPRVSVSDPPSFRRHCCSLLQYPQLFPGVPPFCRLEGSLLLFCSHFVSQL